MGTDFKELKNDNEITEAYNNPNKAIYFCEDGDNTLTKATDMTLEVLIDATCHGFKLMAVEVA